MSNEIDDGGPAFPCSASDALNLSGEMDGNQHQRGMTLRDWFAGMAIQSLAVTALRQRKFREDHGDIFELVESHVIPPEDRDDYAITAAIAAYELADAMLCVRHEHGATT